MPPNDGGAPTHPAPAVSLPSLVRFFLWLGTAGFGGPIALVGYMERTLVAERRWVSRDEFADGLAFCQLAPGPLAAQLAIYIGWLRGGVRGATAIGIAFIGPSFLMVVALAALYQRAGGIAWLQGAFYGIGSAVIAIIARSAVKLARSTLGRDGLLWALFALSAVVTVWTESELVAVFLIAGLVTMAARSWSTWQRASTLSIHFVLPSPLLSALQLPAELAMAWKVFAFFAAAGLFVFGSGLAIVPFLHAGVVVQHAWLTERQFLDAVAVALITPGPVVITVAFIGYLVAGIAGATAAAAGVFAPVYVITLLLAPYYQRLRANVHVGAFVAGVTAAATGAIAGAAVVLGRRAIVDVPSLAMAAIVLLILMIPRVARRIPEPLLIVAAGIAGVFIAAN